MTCPVCADKGVTIVNWADAPSQYAVCLCGMGERMRRLSSGESRTPLWRLWAAREQVDPEAMLLLEDVLTPEELAERGFVELSPEAAIDAVIAAAQQRGSKL